MPDFNWEHEAERELKRVPFFLRPMVRRKVEEMVSKKQKRVVSLADFKEAESRFRQVSSGKSEAELKNMIPVENRPGAQMVIIEVCQNKLTSCPNVLIDTDEWKNAVESWIHRNEISEKLRKRIRGEKIYFHNKFKISISGCPNSCSRPQISDIGIVGTVQPYFSQSNCSHCGACARVCPDFALTVEELPPVFNAQACQGCKKCFEACKNGCITLSLPCCRILMGGKLGRHPHLAEIVTVARKPEELISILDSAIEDYLINGSEEERFADFWIRNFSKNRIYQNK